jgi:hypothetical protein
VCIDIFGGLGGVAGSVVLYVNLFVILGISSKCKRVFSFTKRLITDEQYSLKSDIIKAD